MTFEKFESRGKSSSFFVVLGLCIEKTMKTEIKVTCCVFNTAYIELGKFSNNHKQNYPKGFAVIKKTKVEARMKNESEILTLAPRDVNSKKINIEKVDISTFTKISF